MLRSAHLDFKYQRISSLMAGITLDMITPYTPELKWSVGAHSMSSLLPADLGTLTPRIDASYQSKVYAVTTNAPYNLIDGYTVANARVTWRSEDHLWEFAGAVTNLFDEYYYLTINDLLDALGFISGQPGRPREFAISVKRKF